MAGTSLVERVEATQQARSTGSGMTVYQAVQTPEFTRQLARALPKAMTPERFVRLVMTQVRANPRLLRCDHASFLGAVMTAAQLGLEFDARQLAYLIPRKLKGQWRATAMIGYRGYIELARRSGLVRDVQAHVVYERDEFEVSYGDEPRIVHRPTIVGERGAPIAAYAVAFYKDGGTQGLVLRLDEIEARRARSASGGDGPWVTDWDVMACKSTVRALAAYLPQTPELAYAMVLDEQVRTDHDAEHLDDATIEVPDEDGSADGPGGDDAEEPATDTPPPSAGSIPSALSEYDAMTVPELRVLCAERGLTNSGTKDVLVRRLVEHDERPFTGEGEGEQ